MAFLDKTGLERLWLHINSRLNKKVDKIDGKDLSTNDYTTTEKEKLANLPTPTTADAGKILRVNSEGKYELVSLPNAEEATF